MKKLKTMILLATFIVLSDSSVFAQNATEILQKADNVLNAAKDVTATSTMTIVGKSGNRSTRTMQVFQKGTDKRLVRFLAPADQKGIAFLSLPNDNQMLYLPAFGKTRRIASHVKNTRFAGTDFTYEDIESQCYTDKWDAVLKSKTEDEYILALTPKKETKTEYGKMEIYIKSDNFFPTKTLFFNKKGAVIKQLTVSKIKNQEGFLLAQESEMKDLVAGTATQVKLNDVKINTGLKDDLFTERNLTR